MHSSPNILFILKKRMTSHKDIETISSGLLNSATFVNKMLQKNGYNSHLIEVRDNNEIDREVKKYKADIVIIEALWVVPSKFEVLTKLHPNVKWIIRLHSEIPFIANEGIAMEWVYEYQKFKNVFVSVNSKTTYKDFNNILPKKTIYLPNYYPVNLFDKKNENQSKDKNVLNIGCFGAIRPLKNQVIQAIAAIKLAEFLGKKLKFHINSGRIEQKGDSIYKNLKELFEGNKRHKLVLNQWAPRKEFLKLCGKMDIGMQVSFSETFNIVSADVISQSVPIVTSKEIPWISRFFSAKTTSVNSIFFKLLLSYFFSKFNVMVNQCNLTSYTTKTKKIWLEYFK